jgi:hypothetical protein
MSDVGLGQTIDLSPQDAALDGFRTRRVDTADRNGTRATQFAILKGGTREATR